MSRPPTLPKMTRIWMPVGFATSAMKPPPLSASRMAEVATATISSTLWESASRRNLARVCSAAVTAVGVRLRPSSPPAPRRTISFSLSMTSKDRSGRTRTTIMWIELVPMSMAAMRMSGETGWQGWPGACLLHQRYILPVRSIRAASYHEPFIAPGPSSRASRARIAAAVVVGHRGQRRRRAPGARGVTAPPGDAAGPDRGIAAQQIGESATQDSPPDAGAGYGSRAGLDASPDRRACGTARRAAPGARGSPRPRDREPRAAPGVDDRAPRDRRHRQELSPTPGRTLGVL